MVHLENDSLNQYYLWMHLTVFIYLLYLLMCNLEYYVSFMCTIQLFNICTHYKITVNLVTIYHIQNYYSIVDYIIYAVHYITVAYLFY